MFRIESVSTRGPGNYIRMRSAQLNSKALGHVFRMAPESVFLVAENGNVELPDMRGAFNVHNMDSSLLWCCEGSYLGAVRTRRRGMNSFSVRVSESAWIKMIEVYDFNGIGLRKICNLPVPLTEQSSSVSSVSQLVSQETFAGAAVVLLDWENLRIPDAVRTRGI